MPWTMNVVSASMRMLTRPPSRAPPCRPLALRARLDGRRGRRPAALDALDRTPRGLVQRHRAVGVLDAVALEDLETLLLPGAGNAKDRDLLGRIEAELQAGFDDAARDDVHARVGDDRHHHRDALDAGL